MVNRLVVGNGSLGQRVVERLSDHRGSTRVLTTDEHHGESLREMGVAVEVAESVNEASLASFDQVDLVFVSADLYERNLRLAKRVSQSLPGAYVIVYAGDDAGDRAGELEPYADTVIDLAGATADHLVDRVGDASLRMRQLRAVLRTIDSLAIVTHDNPDPDALASGIALERLAESVGCTADVCYHGDITHQENRAFVNLLGLELRNIESEDELDEFDGIALVDHSRPGVNNQLPEETPVDIVIDHHPPKTPVDAQFVDLRSDVGATSTLLVEYLEQFDIPIEEDIATALLFGIRVDTNAFSREVDAADFHAAATLVTRADMGTLDRIESPDISTQTFGTIADAITNRRVEGQFLLSCVGELSERDALAQAADRLLNLDGITTVLVYGIMDGTIYISARSRGSEIDLGETLREAFGQIGSAGGHVDMAGAQIELGFLESVEDDNDSLIEIVESVVTNRFFDVVEIQASLSTPVYADDEEATEKYLEPEARVIEVLEESESTRVAGDVEIGDPESTDIPGETSSLPAEKSARPSEESEEGNDTAEENDGT